ncbi:cytochrome P450 [Lentinula raphanica]|uniref:Cytochrome P450 n=1 Tax=Lentinula raphanica TaxID=153919 RepID=A0AA38U990_9AGAR|nr:cytochrome P450 [Lentinula raphanica]KAJ3977211.1 cytochrome P450 [Lentinula raphanica]
MDPLTFLALIFGLAWSFYLYNRSGKRADTVRLPPGPKPLPLIGNILDLTSKELWIKATSFAQTYGPIFQLSILHPSLPISQPLIFLSSPDVCFDLLDKKGGIYADKPKLVMAGELCGCENMVAFTGYGAQSRRQRKLLGMALSKERIPAYQGLIERETAGFLTGLLSAHSASSTVSSPSEHTLPSRFLAYLPLIRRYAGQLTLSVIYGYTVPTSYTQIVHDEFLDMAEDCLDILSNRIASGGGIWLVDIFPWLKGAPKAFESLPLFSFLPKARAWKAKMVEFVEKPFEWVKTEMRKGTHKPSFCSTLLENSDAVVRSQAVVAKKQPRRNSDIPPELLSSWASISSNSVKTTSANAKEYAQFEFDLKWTANSMYSASGDTTVTSVMHYFLALLHDADRGGEVVRKARLELDLVTGLANDSLPTIKPRLPSLSDRYVDVDIPDGKGGTRRVKKPRFPYVEAVMSEVWRWGVVVPLNLPHRLTQDDVYIPPPSPSNPHPSPVFLRKGSLIFGNIWSILRSKELFGDDVDDFRPERYLLSPHEEEVLYGPHDHYDEDEYESIKREKRKRDPRSYVFGFGRRQCPGQNLVESSVWLLTASLLSTVDVRRPCVEGEDGKERVVREKVEFNNSVFRTPDPFGVDIRPRSEKALEVIMLAGEGEEAESL